MSKLFLIVLLGALLSRGGLTSAICRRRATSFQCHDLTELPPDVGANVNRVDVSYGRIAVIDDNFFRGVKEVRSFLAAHNDIVAVERGAFGRLANLTMVDLSFNQLESLHYGVFADNHRLEVVYLSGNPLAVHPGLPILQSDSLRKLKADHTRINHFTETSFNLMRNVEYMSFEGNAVAKFGYDAIKLLYRLEKLDFGKPADADCYQQSVFQMLPKIKGKTDLTAEICPSESTSTTPGRRDDDLKRNTSQPTTAGPDKSNGNISVSIDEAAAGNMSTLQISLLVILGLLILLAIVALLLCTTRQHSKKRKGLLPVRTEDQE